MAKPTPITARLPKQLLEAIEALARTRTRTRNEQLVHMLEGALRLDLERLPLPLPGEGALEYRERLHNLAEGGGS